MEMHLFIFIFLFSICSYSQKAAGFTNSGRFQIGTGVLSYNAFKTTKSEQSKSSFIGENYILPIQGIANFSLFSLNFSPRVLFTPVPIKAKDGGNKTSILLISIPVKTQLWNSFSGGLGLGYMIRSIKGSGGTTELNNGLSTDTFLLPSKTVKTKNFLLEPSISYNVNDQYNIDLEGLISSPLSSQRTFSFLLTLNYKL